MFSNATLPIPCTGSFLDSDGNPCAGATINATVIFQNNIGEKLALRFTAETDAQGNYGAVLNVPQDAAFVVSATAVVDGEGPGDIKR